MPNNKKKTRTAAVAFKVEAELADLLDRLPNKSAFIRAAIAAQLRVTCPLCLGKGIVPPAVHNHYAPLVAPDRLRSCTGCGHEITLPTGPGELAPEDRVRLEQYMLGGPLYCDNCFSIAPACNDCGWHIDGWHLSEHQRRLHPRAN
jgi:hypothetical protein